MPRSNKTPVISKTKKFEQQQLEIMPLLKKPLELVGSTVNVPGKFWEGTMTRAEQETLYQCTVRDLHRYMCDSSDADRG